MKTLSGQATTQKQLAGVNMVWMVKATLDEFGLLDVYKYWGSRTYMIGTSPNEEYYRDLFSKSGGISLGETTVAPRGGLASVGSFTISLRDEEDESAALAEYVVINDEVIVYQIFSNGAEVVADRFEIIRGVIERAPVIGDEWRLTVKDDSKALLKEFPVAVLSFAQYPFAYEPDQVIPEAFGNLNHGPDDGDGLSAVLAPIQMTDKYAVRGTSGRRKKAQGDVYQWYSAAGRLAKVVTDTPNSDILQTVDVPDPQREMVTRPIRTVASNDVTDWQDAIDGDLTTGATIVNGDNLDVYLSGVPNIGQMTDLDIEVKATGDYTISVYDDTTLRVGPNAVSGDNTEPLTLGNWDTWALALMNVRIDGPATGSAEINDIKLVIEFNDFQSTGDEPPDLWQSVIGYEDQTANYRDGAVISGAGTALRNPVHQLEAIQRDTNFLNLLEAQVVSGWADAATSRTDWKFDFFLSDIQDEKWLEDYCFQAGLHMFPEEGGFSVAAMDKTRAPQHFFSGDWHMPAKNGTDPDPSKWEVDFQVAPVDASQIINEASIRYRLHGPSGTYKEAATASGQYRLTGRCNLTAAGVLTRVGGSSFITNEVTSGERIYIANDIEYEVDGPPISSTQLNVTVVGGGTPSVISNGTYYLGPNLDATMLLSQISFKRTVALGKEQKTASDDGGYKSDLIVDDDTADLLLEHIKDWFAYPRDFVSFPLTHTAVDVQLGDVIMLDHSRIEASKRPLAMTTIDGDHLAGDTIISLAAGTAWYYSVDDYALFLNPDTAQPEMALVSAVTPASDTITVTRGLLGTAAQALEDGWTVYRVTTQWMVVGLRPMTPADPVIRIKAVQMPSNYIGIGHVVVPGYPDYSTASTEERLQSGWTTLRNGRVLDLDPDSAISHVGPDSGTYPIT